MRIVKSHCVRALLALAFLAFPLTGTTSFAASADRFAGRPTIEIGTSSGAFFWSEGERWHVRWTSADAAHRFTGSIIAIGGELEGLRRIDVEKELRVVGRSRPARVRVGPRGRVRAVGGGPVVNERVEDRIEKTEKNVIVWSSRNYADMDGFDFKLGKGVRRLELRCEVDGPTGGCVVRIGSAAIPMREQPLIVDLEP